jgi:TrmH family RNA methyltransferase
VKRLHQLLDKKARQKTGLMLVEGVSAVEQLVRNFPDKVQELWVDENLMRGDGTNSGAANKDSLKRVQHIFDAFEYSKLATRAVIDAVSKDAQGIVASAHTDIKISDSAPEVNANKAQGPVIVLNNAQDPGNAGTIIRAAAALGASRVIFTGESVDKWNPKVIRSSVGGVFQMPISHLPKLGDATGQLKKEERYIIAADLYGTSETPAHPIGERQKDEPVALVFGNEAHGLTPEEVNLADECLFIPLKPDVESLNLAGAVQIFLWEFTR